MKRGKSGGASGSAAFGVSEASSAVLYGREAELRLLAGLLDGVQNRGAASVVRGEPGIGKSALLAAATAGYTRLRPVLMTASAMILGMVPMALGIGEGGEQNAPLGRAVIGGLLFATFATLIFVPTMYLLLRRHPKAVTDPTIIGRANAIV